jgi:phenylalanyl-tRNA synthetase beta chain
VRGAALFEVGHVFREGEPVDERESVAGAFWGRAGQGLHIDEHGFDVFDAKGALDVLLDGLGIDDRVLGDPAPLPFHPGRSALVTVGERAAGVVGELHPRVVRDSGLGSRVAVFELDVDVLTAHARRGTPFRDVPRFPPVRRDLAFIVPEEVAAGAVQATLEAAAGPLLEQCVLFDEHRGAPLPDGSKSLGFAIDLRAPDRTLTDEDARTVVEAIVDRIREAVGGELRTG